MKVNNYGRQTSNFRRQAEFETSYPIRLRSTRNGASGAKLNDSIFGRLPTVIIWHQVDK